jgi:hypothetical protein
VSTFNVERLNFIVGEIIVDEIRRLHSPPRQGHDECNWALPPIDSTWPPSNASQIEFARGGGSPYAPA